MNEVDVRKSRSNMRRGVERFLFVDESTALRKRSFYIIYCKGRRAYANSKQSLAIVLSCG